MHTVIKMDAALNDITSYELFKILIRAGADLICYFNLSSFVVNAMKSLDNNILRLYADRVRECLMTMYIDSTVLILWISTTPISETSLETLRLICDIIYGVGFPVMLVRAIEIGKIAYADIIMRRIIADDTKHNTRFLSPGVGVFIEAIRESPETLRYLLAHGLRKEFEPHVIEPVHTAVSNIKSLEILLEAGFNPNDRNEEGRTPLHDAYILKEYDAIKLLLKYGADQTIVDMANKTPVDYNDDHDNDGDHDGDYDDDW